MSICYLPISIPQKQNPHSLLYFLIFVLSVEMRAIGNIATIFKLIRPSAAIFHGHVANIEAEVSSRLSRTITESLPRGSAKHAKVLVHRCEAHDDVPGRRRTEHVYSAAIGPALLKEEIVFKFHMSFFFYVICDKGVACQITKLQW